MARVGDKDGAIGSHPNTVGIFHSASDHRLRVAARGERLLDDAAVAGVGDINVPAGIDRDFPGLIQARDHGRRRGVNASRLRNFIDRSVVEAGVIDVAQGHRQPGRWESWRPVTIPDCTQLPPEFVSSKIWLFPLSQTYTLPAPSTATASGLFKPVATVLCI